MDARRRTSVVTQCLADPARASTAERRTVGSDTRGLPGGGPLRSEGGPAGGGGPAPDAPAAVLVYRVPARSSVAHLYPECADSARSHRGPNRAFHLSVTPLSETDAPLCLRCLARRRAIDRPRVEAIRARHRASA